MLHTFNTLLSNWNKIIISCIWIQFTFLTRTKYNTVMSLFFLHHLEDIRAIMTFDVPLFKNKWIQLVQFSPKPISISYGFVQEISTLSDFGLSNECKFVFRLLVTWCSVIISVWSHFVVFGWFLFFHWMLVCLRTFVKETKFCCDFTNIHSVYSIYASWRSKDLNLPRKWQDETELPLSSQTRMLKPNCPILVVDRTKKLNLICLWGKKDTKCKSNQYYPECEKGLKDPLMVSINNHNNWLQSRPNMWQQFMFKVVSCIMCIHCLFNVYTM